MKPHAVSRNQAAISAQPLRTRNITFDLLRLVFACMVLLSHAPEITDGNNRRELLGSALHLPLTFGLFGIYGFFLLSGYLIVRSWMGAPNLLDFLQKRMLRIIPGYAVAVALSVIGVGLLAPATPHFFRGLPTGHFVLSVLTLSAPLTPRVFPRLHNAGVNGSLWTITYEFRCYLLVALFGVTGLLRRRTPWLALTAVVFVIDTDLFLQSPLSWRGHYLLSGDPYRVYQLLLPFLMGGCYALYRETIPFRRSLAALAVGLTAVFLKVPVFQDGHHALSSSGFMLCFSYLMFYAGQVRWPVPARLQHLPDISYGTYLYGWPVQCLWISAVGGSPWVTVAVSTPVSMALGWLSWQWVERPALRCRRRPTAPAAGADPVLERGGTLP